MFFPGHPSSIRRPRPAAPDVQAKRAVDAPAPGTARLGLSITKKLRVSDSATGVAPTPRRADPRGSVASSVAAAKSSSTLRMQPRGSVAVAIASDGPKLQLKRKRARPKSQIKLKLDKVDKLKPQVQASLVKPKSKLKLRPDNLKLRGSVAKVKINKQWSNLKLSTPRFRGSVAATAEPSGFGAGMEKLRWLCGHWTDTKGNSYALELNASDAMVLTTTRSNGAVQVSRGLIRCEESSATVVWAGRGIGSVRYVLRKLDADSLAWETPGRQPFYWDRFCGGGVPPHSSSDAPMPARRPPMSSRLSSLSSSSRAARRGPVDGPSRPGKEADRSLMLRMDDALRRGRDACLEALAKLVLERDEDLQELASNGTGPALFVGACAQLLWRSVLHLARCFWRLGLPREDWLRPVSSARRLEYSLQDAREHFREFELLAEEKYGGFDKILGFGADAEEWEQLLTDLQQAYPLEPL